MSVGSIVVSLLLKTGSFETDTKRAQKRISALEGAVNVMASRVAIGFTAASASVGGMVLKTTQAAQEIKRFSDLAGASGVEFQKMAVGANTVGISQEKLADQFKDFREKFGEYLDTGGGGMKDFFENIAPKIGVTADQFRKLSGPQALQLYVSSLEKANLSQEQMSFYLESVASDTTALIPLLRNNGAALKEIGAQAEATGQIMSDELIANSVEFRRQMDQLMGILKGFSNTVTQELLPSLIRMSNEFLAGMQNANGLFDAISKFGTINPFRSESENLKVYREELKELYEFRDQQAKRGGIFGSTAAVDKDIADVEAKIKYLETLQSRNLKAFPTASDNRGFAGTLPPPPPKPLAGGTLGKDSKAKKEKEYIDPLTDSAKEYAKAMDSINRAQISAAMSWQDLTSTQQTLLTLFASPEFLNMPDEWKRSVVEAGEFAIQQEKINESQMRLNELLGESELEKQREDMMLLAEAFENGSISADQYGEAVRKALGLEDEEGSYWDRWLESAQSAMMSFNDIAASVINQFTTGFGNAFEKMVFDGQNLKESFKGLAESMARSVVNALGQMAAQWLAYQAVQLLVGKTSQASASSAQTFEAMAAQQMSAIHAFSSTAAIPVVGPAAAPAAAGAALAATAPFVATIASLGAAAVGARATGGPVSADAPYLVGERGPELFVPSTAGRIVPNNVMGKDSEPIVQNINISTGVAQTVRAEIMTLMPQIISAAKSAVADSRMRGGSYGNSMR